jgi:hypothetical protein
VCGGAISELSAMLLEQGPSPRVQGSPVIGTATNCFTGSIPACAGSQVEGRRLHRSTRSIPACAREPLVANMMIFYSNFKQQGASSLFCDRYAIKIGEFARRYTKTFNTETAGQTPAGTTAVSHSRRIAPCPSHFTISSPSSTVKRSTRAG